MQDDGYGSLFMGLLAAIVRPAVLVEDAVLSGVWSQYSITGVLVMALFQNCKGHLAFWGQD